MSVAKNAGKMGVATLLSRFFGLAREQVFAFLFGASDAADAFNIAFRIPNLLRDLFAEGAMSSAFVPNFVRALEKDKQKSAAFKLLVANCVVLFVILSFLTVLGFIFSEQLVAFFASKYQEIPGKHELTVGLTRTMFPFFPMIAFAALFMGALNALGAFFMPAFAPVLFNLASIVCGIALTPLLSKYTTFHPIYSMAIGVLLGGFLQFFIQWRQLNRIYGFRFFSYREAIRSPFQVEGLKQVLILIIPGAVGLAATQLNVLINSIYATSQGSGAVSWLNYAFRLMQFPIGIFGVSIATATLPLISSKLAKGDGVSASQELKKSLSMTFAINAPAAAGLMALGLPIIQILFQHGKFTFHDSEQCASALFWYSIGLPGYSLIKVMVPVFYAMNKSRIPVIVSFISVGVNLFFCHLMLEIYHFSFWALALSTSIIANLNPIILSFFLSKDFKNVFDYRFLSILVRNTALSVIIYYSALITSNFAASNLSFLYSHLVWMIQISSAGLVTFGIWFGFGKLFGIQEITQLAEFIQKKLLNRFKKVS